MVFGVEVGVAVGPKDDVVRVGFVWVVEVDDEDAVEVGLVKAVKLVIGGLDSCLR